MISEEKYIEVASRLGIDVASIKAVSEVESGGSGFLPTGEPVILFEPHVFWKRLIAHGVHPDKVLLAHPEDHDILYPKWGSYPYGKISAQHSRLIRAVVIDRDSALESASWGRFQILGMHWQSLGYASLQKFINDMYRDEDSQLEVFVKFIQAHNLVKYLRDHEWAEFALRYNGKGYKKNKYDEKLQRAYDKYK